MRKISLIATVCMLIVLISCTNNSGTSSSDPDIQKNLYADSIISKTFDTGDTTGLRGVLADNCISHTDRGDMGKDSIIAMALMMKTMAKGMKSETLHKTADKDYVFSWYRLTGTSDGSMGMPKGPYDMHALEITKYKDGKCIEHWEYVDPMEMMKMMAPQQTGNMKMDSTNKK